MENKQDIVGELVDQTFEKVKGMTYSQFHMFIHYLKRKVENGLTFK